MYNDIKGNKIVLVGNTSWSMYNFRMPLMRDLMELGYVVAVIAPPDEFSSRMEDEGVDFYPILIDGKGSNPVKDRRTLATFRRLYRSIKPDLIIHYTIKPNIYGTLAAAYLGYKSIAITTGLGQIFQEKSLRARVVKRLYKIAFRYPERILFLNSDDRDTFYENNLLKDPSRAFVLPGEGIALNSFTRSVPLPKEERKFLLVGRLLRPKGVEEYVRAARVVRSKYPEAIFSILGFVNEEDPTSVTLKELETWDEEDVIKFLGSTDDVKKYLEETSCLVLPSYYREGVPRVLLEAASMGVPIITTDNVGCREVVIDGVSGYIVPIKEVESLAAAAEKIIQASDEELVQMGKAGRQLIEDRFSQERVSSELIALIEQALL